MASGWAHFRKVWLKPEVYPLVGAMGAALGVMAVALVNKARSPNVAWNKSKRGSGTLYDDIDEVVPLWNDSKNNSTSIFQASSGIRDSKRQGRSDLGSFVIKAAADEEEEEEEQQQQQQQQQQSDESDEATEEQASVAQSVEHVMEQVTNQVSDESAETQASVVQSVAHVLDESADAINAAVDAALRTAEDVSESVSESVVESVAPPLPTADVQPAPADASQSA
ncbi:unnamed protein product [Agarophyton chilense]